jgi:pseudouridine synthase
MRLNKFLAENTDLSRRKADSAIENGRVKVNGEVAKLGKTLSELDTVSIDGSKISVSTKKHTTILLNKPVGYVCSKDGQGSKTVYDLLPEEYRSLNIAGRLDKDSSGLVILTNDGQLLNTLTHPSNNKEKIYEVTVNKELTTEDLELLKTGVDIGEDRPSKFTNIDQLSNKKYEITLEEGRNRQIRRTLEEMNNEVLSLRRLKISNMSLGNLSPKEFRKII